MTGPQTPLTVECFGDPGGAHGPFVITCEHASNNVAGYASGASDERLLKQHWGWDIGALAIAKNICQTLDCVGVATLFSRLLLDVNRSLDSNTLIVERCGLEEVGFNQDLDDAQRAWRIKAFHTQYHDTVSNVIRQRLQRGPVHLLSIHSFTPTYDGDARTMEVGVLFDKHADLAADLARALSAEGFTTALNEPYSGLGGELMYSANRHGEAHGIPYLELEIRQDLISTPAEIVSVAHRITRALRVFFPKSYA
ncbi:MAG: N-formylglutamate amidohydrolase [Myxococcota bacterium]|nr:N-formylglutamate amidohydrolase [Myxococcota bacterium]